MELFGSCLAAVVYRNGLLTDSQCASRVTGHSQRCTSELHYLIQVGSDVDFADGRALDNGVLIDCLSCQFAAGSLRGFLHLRIAIVKAFYCIDCSVHLGTLFKLGIQRGVLYPCTTSGILHPYDTVAVGTLADDLCVGEGYLGVGTGLQGVEGSDVTTHCVLNRLQSNGFLSGRRELHHGIGQVAVSTLQEAHTSSVARPTHAFDGAAGSGELINVAVAGCGEGDAGDSIPLGSVKGQSGVLLIEHETLTAISVSIDTRGS